MAKADVAAQTEINNHPVVSAEVWVAARTALLVKETEFTRLRDELSRQRRDLPWEKIEKEYVFAGPDGKETLADLFENRSQLVVYHFMYPPEWEDGCPHCSFWADSFNGIPVHLNHRDVSFVAISRAPWSKIEAFKKRMGWGFKWLSSDDGPFNYDLKASFTPEARKNGTSVYNYKKQDPGFPDREGVSVFYRAKDGAIYHTYSAYARGIDLLNTAYNYLDLVPKGRDEGGLEFTQAWVRHHDRYED